LRQYSAGRRRIARESSEATVGTFHPLGQLDLVGGNGRWRQKRAKEQRVLDQAEAEKQRHEDQVIEDEKRRRREDREARRRRQHEEDQQRQRMLEEKMRRERLAQDERERQEEEERHRQAAQERSEWLARQPKTCSTCMGSGKCTYCGGEGFFFAMFLAPSVGKDSMGFGRAPQGCPECGGCAQNIRGALVKGSGNCYACDGVGTVTPNVEVKRRFRTMRTKWKKLQTGEFGTGSQSVGTEFGECSPTASECCSPTSATFCFGPLAGG
jgi:flagellar biosynthesis GTPase FlhF